MVLKLSFGKSWHTNCLCCYTKLRKIYTKGGIMRKSVYAFALILLLMFCLADAAMSQEKPIVLGAPLATAFLYGWDAERGINLAAF